MIAVCIGASTRGEEVLLGIDRYAQPGEPPRQELAARDVVHSDAPRTIAANEARGTGSEAQGTHGTPRVVTGVVCNRERRICDRGVLDSHADHTAGNGATEH